MSGGVDSSVAAALLAEQGYEVVGMMMRLWSDNAMGGAEHNRCCTPEQMSDARRIADHLRIPFYVLDTQEVFRATVVEYFLDQHRRGMTPNPCLECNRHIRFDWLLKMRWHWVRIIWQQGIMPALTAQIAAFTDCSRDWMRPKIRAMC